MIGVDTNLLVRYLTHDDRVQGPLAMRVLANSEGVFVAKTVLLELEWMLRAAYQLPRAAIETALLQVVGLPNVVVERPEHIAAALDGYHQGLDFANALHYASTPVPQFSYLRQPLRHTRSRPGSGRRRDRQQDRLTARGQRPSVSRPLDREGITPERGSRA